MLYSLYLTFIQRISNKKTLIVSFVSLIIGFIFVLIFVGKTDYTQSAKHRIQMTSINDSVSYISWIPQDISNLNLEINDEFGEHTLILRISSINAQSNAKKEIASAYLIDKKINDYLNLGNLDKKELREFFSSEKNAILSFSFSKKLGISEGDEFLLNGIKKKCFTILDDFLVIGHYDILINSNKALLSTNALYSYTVLTESTNENTILDELKFLSPSLNDRIVNSLGRTKNRLIRRLNDVLKDSFFFTVFFLFIAVSNLHLIFLANISIHRKSVAIKSAYGETNLKFVLSEIIYSTIFAIISFNLSIAVYLNIRNFLPRPLIVNITNSVYFYSLLLTILITVFLSLLSIKTTRKISSIDVLRT